MDNSIRLSNNSINFLYEKIAMLSVWLNLNPWYHWDLIPFGPFSYDYKTLSTKLADTDKRITILYLSTYKLFDTSI
jgi:hypothetical protein